jgi:DNA-binding IclR family transcriptional regulator
VTNQYVKTNRSVERAIALLTMVCQSKSPLGLTEIAREMDLDKATALRLLSSLRNANFIQQDPESRHYVRGPGIFSLWPNEICQISRPYLENLSEQTQETACLILPRGEAQRICIDAVHPDRELRVVAPVGKLVPIYGGASGAVLLAFRPVEDTERILEKVGLEPITDQSLTETTAFFNRLDKVRELGYAHGSGEVTKGTYAIAAPILDKAGFALGAVVLRGPDARVTDDVISDGAALVMQAGEAISGDLDMTPPPIFT